jgi:hypothetical protein
MTYNFDPERWFDNEMAALEARLKNGEIDDAEFAAEKERLVDEYEKMLARLDIRHDYSSKPS